MKNVFIIVALISILLVIGILYYDSYACSALHPGKLESYSEPFKSVADEELKAINARHNFTITDAELPRFKQLLMDNKFMNFKTVEEETGFKFVGSYNDRGWTTHKPIYKMVQVYKWVGRKYVKRWERRQVGTATEQTDRAIPNYNNRWAPNPAECIRRAREKGDTISGSQFYGQCFSGTDLNRATQYGRHGSQYPLGVGWNNMVYANKKEMVERIEDIDDKTAYENVIKWLVSDEIKVNNFEEFNELLEFLKTEGFTTIEGAETMANAPTPPKTESTAVTAMDVLGNTFESIKNDWETKMSDPPPQTSTSYRFEFIKNSPQYPKLVPDTISELVKLDTNNLTAIREIFKKNDIRNSYELKQLTDDLAKIGYTHKSTASIYQILEALNKYGRKGFEIDDVFIAKYQSFGLTSESDLLDFLSKLVSLGVSDPKDVPINSDLLTFGWFAQSGGEFGLGYASFNRFYSIMNGFAHPSSNEAFTKFVDTVRKYYSNYRRYRLDLNIIENFKSDLKKYAITYSEYELLINNYLSKVSLSVSYKATIANFVEYYNTDYDPGSPAITTDGTLDGKISLYDGITRFFTTIQNNGFVFPADKTGFDFTRMLREYSELNVSGATAKAVKNVIQPFTTGSFSRIDGRIEGLETMDESSLSMPKYTIYGYYDALKKLGITDVNKMLFILPEQESAGAQPQTQAQLDSRLTSYLTANSNTERAKILSYLVSVGAPSNVLYKILYLLSFIGVNMSNFDQITQAFYSIGLNDFNSIFTFLEKLYLMNVNIQGLTLFTDTLAEFGTSYKKSPSKFMNMLDMFIYYDVVNKTSKYDTVNTKFYNFMYNMKLDGIGYDQFTRVQGTILDVLNQSKRTTIPTEDEKRLIEEQLRDVIIRKDSLLFGVDNTLYGKNSMEGMNDSTFELDHTVNIGHIYKNITNNGTIMDLVPITQNGNIAVVDPAEIYAISLVYSDYINDKNLRLICRMLTPYEYGAFKNNADKLHVRSVMSRLCSIVQTFVSSPDNSSGMLMEFMLNAIRTFPYKTFDFLKTAIRRSGTTYDLDNSRDYVGNIYMLPPPVKEGSKTGFTTLSTASSYGDYHSLFSKPVSYEYRKNTELVGRNPLLESYDLSKTSFVYSSAM